MQCTRHLVLGLGRSFHSMYKIIHYPPPCFIIGVIQIFANYVNQVYSFIIILFLREQKNISLSILYLGFKSHQPNLQLKVSYIFKSRYHYIILSYYLLYFLVSPVVSFVLQVTYCQSVYKEILCGKKGWHIKRPQANESQLRSWSNGHWSYTQVISKLKWVTTYLWVYLSRQVFFGCYVRCFTIYV